jgi:hypothetical protein
MMRYGIVTIGLASLALAGCEAIPNQGHLSDPTYGQALRQNLAAQVADPAPDYERTEPPASSGPRTALAQKRYETGQVIQPVAQATSSVSGGSSGGGGGK